MKIRILGCDGGLGGERRTVSLQVDDDILIDAGSGAGDLALDEIVRIDHIFLTHSHLDHIALLPMLIDAAAEYRSQPVTVHALPETITALRECVFDGRLWPDYSAIPSPDAPYFRYSPIVVGTPVALGTRQITPLPARHSVPGVGYQMDCGTGAFVYSGDTTLDERLWAALDRLPELKHLMIECTFLNAHAAIAERSGHMTPALLALGLQRLAKPVEVLIAHMESGREEEMLAEIAQHVHGRPLRRLMRGEIFEL